MAANLRKFFLGKNVGHKSHGLVNVQRHAVGRDNAGRFLSTMLQRMQAKIGERLRLRMLVDRHHAAFVAKFVVVSRQLSALPKKRHSDVVGRKRKPKSHKTSVALFRFDTIKNTVSGHEVKHKIQKSQCVPVQAMHRLPKNIGQ